MVQAMLDDEGKEVGLYYCNYCAYGSSDAKDVQKHEQEHLEYRQRHQSKLMRKLKGR